MPKSLKTTKIKRYRYAHGGKRSSTSVVVRTVLLMLMLGIFGFVGWNAYGPISEYLSGTLAATLEAQQARAAAAQAAASGTQNAENAGSNAQEAAPPAESPGTAKELPALRAVYLPPSSLTNLSKLETQLDQLKQNGYNALLIDLKDSAGVVPYRSDLESVTLAKAQSALPYDLELVCQELEERDMYAIGRMHAFRDPLASSRIPDAGVKYMGADTLWLDDFPNNGGKPWLNPYSTQAQGYIVELVNESLSYGVDQIMLDSVSFPTGYGLEQASFGSAAAGVPQSQILSQFVSGMQDAVARQGGSLSLYVSGLSALGVNDAYYGGNPTAMSDARLALGVMPSQFGNAYTSETFSLTAPILHPYETVRALLKQLSLPNEGLIAMVQGNTATGSIANNRVYTAEDISEQLRALEEQGIQSYILYSPNGDYPIGLFS